MKKQNDADKPLNFNFPTIYKRERFSVRKYVCEREKERERGRERKGGGERETSSKLLTGLVIFRIPPKGRIASENE